jgi:short-subunit dehydrogenase
MKTFKDKVIIITGAGAGIGKALSKELAELDARIIISDIQKQNLEQTVAEISDKGGRVEADVMNVTDKNAFTEHIDRVFEKYGRLDYLFNIAGIAIVGETQDSTIDVWEKVLNVNLNGMMYGAVHAYKKMVHQGFGHIVNMSSMEGLLPFPYMGSYVTSKYAVVGMSNVMRVEGAPLGVKVSVICPGFIQTAILDSPSFNINRENLIKTLPLAFIISAEECAKRILKGVARNKTFIVVTGVAKVLWMMARLSPSLMVWLISKQHSFQRKKIHIKNKNL